MADVTTQPVNPGTNTGALDWTTIISSILSGIGAFSRGGLSDTRQAQNAANIANPYGSQYAQWWPQIVAAMKGEGDLQSTATGLLNDPTSFLQSKMFTQPLKLGGESLARQFGAGGGGYSGNLDLALQDYGQNQAYKFLGQTEDMYSQAMGNQRGIIDQLIKLGGVTAGSPADAANLYTKGLDNRRNDFGNLAAGLGSLFGPALSNLIKSIFGGGGGGGGAPWTSGYDVPSQDPTQDPSTWTGGYDVSSQDPSTWTGGFDVPSQDPSTWTSGFDLPLG